MKDCSDFRGRVTGVRQVYARLSGYVRWFIAKNMGNAEDAENAEDKEDAKNAKNAKDT